MAKRDGFILHEKTMAQIAMLTDEQAGELLKAMIVHYNGEHIANMSQIVNVLMIDISERMDADKASFEEISQKRKKAGQQGALNRWHSESTNMTQNSTPIANDGKRIAKHGESDSDSDSESVSPTEIKRKTFKKPSIEEVREYCRERNNKVDAEAFIAFYESKGWKVGNASMKDWKAAVITWEKRQKAKPTPAGKFANFPQRQDDDENQKNIQKLLAMQ